MRLINQYQIFIHKVRETKLSDFTLSELIYKLIDSQLNTTRILDLVGKWDEAISLLEVGIEIAKKLGHSHPSPNLEIQSILKRTPLAELKRSLGWLLMNKGRMDEAMELFVEAKTIAKEGCDMSEYSIAIGNMGTVFWNKGDYDNAMLCYEEQKKISEKLSDRRGYSIAVGNIGHVYRNKGDYDKARLCYEKRKKICEELGDRKGYVIAIGNIGNVYAYKGDYNKAMLCYKKRKQIAEELGDRKGYGLAVGNMGNIYAYKGDYDNAILCYEEQKKIAEELGDRRGYSISIGNMANLYQYKGKYDETMKCYNEAIKIGQELGINYLLCSYINGKASLLFDLRKILEAKKLNYKALRIAKKVNRQDTIFNASLLKIKIYAELLDKNRAIKEMKALVDEPFYKEDINKKSFIKGDLGRFSDEQTATIHYELWKLTGDATHRNKATTLYQALYENTPKYEYKKRLDEIKETL